MRELDYQRLLIKVIKDHGGFAFKSSNRFLIGVADVFFTLPYINAMNNQQSGFLEVKFNRLPARSTTLIRLDTTVKQRQFLNNVIQGGARGGVMSFVVGKGFFGVCIVPPETTELSIERHIAYGKGKEDVTWRVLEEWLND